MPIAGAARVDPLLLPDHAARRGAALVSRRRGHVLRHLDGRRPRPGAGRLRRDGVPVDGARTARRFYDPLGLVSEGTKIDFQLQIELVPLRHALHDLAGAHVRAREGRRSWISRRDGSRAYYADAVRARSSAADRQAPGPAGSRTSTTFQQAEPRGHPQVPDHALPGPDAAGARLGVARLLTTRRTRTLYAGVNYPGRRLARRRRSRSRPARSTRLVDIKGPTMYTVTSLARDPAAGTLFYTTDNGAYRDLVPLDPATRRTHACCRRTRASATWRSTAPTGRCGASGS